MGYKLLCVPEQEVRAKDQNHPLRRLSTRTQFLNSVFGGDGEPLSDISDEMEEATDRNSKPSNPIVSELTLLEKGLIDSIDRLLKTTLPMNGHAR